MLHSCLCLCVTKFTIGTTHTLAQISHSPLQIESNHNCCVVETTACCVLNMYPYFIHSPPCSLVLPMLHIFRSTHRMIRIGRVLCRSAHWRTCKRFAVRNSIRTAKSIRLVRIRKRSGYASTHHWWMFGKCATLLLLFGKGVLR